LVCHPLDFWEENMAKGQTTKKRETTKVSKAKKKAKDDAETMQPANSTALGHDEHNTQRKDEGSTGVMGEVEERSQNQAVPNEQESDAESIQRRTTSMDSGEDDYAENTEEDSEDNLDQDNLQQNNMQRDNLDQAGLHKDADTYDAEDQAEGEDYDEDEEEDEQSDEDDEDDYDEDEEFENDDALEDEEQRETR
jgi:hypothetical protein